MTVLGRSKDSPCLQGDSSSRGNFINRVTQLAVVTKVSSLSQMLFSLFVSNMVDCGGWLDAEVVLLSSATSLFDRYPARFYTEP